MIESECAFLSPCAVAAHANICSVSFDRPRDFTRVWTQLVATLSRGALIWRSNKQSGLGNSNFHWNLMNYPVFVFQLMTKQITTALLRTQV